MLPSSVIHAVTSLKKAEHFLRLSHPAIIVIDIYRNRNLLDSLISLIGLKHNYHLTAIVSDYNSQVIHECISKGVNEILIWESNLSVKYRQALERTLVSIDEGSSENLDTLIESLNLASFIDSCHDLICIVDTNGTILFTNQVLTEQFSGTFNGRTALSDIVHQNDISRVETELQIVISRNSLAEVVFRLKNRSDDWQTLQANMQGFEWKNQNYAILFLRNITELHQIQLNLHETEQKYRLFEDSVSDVLYRYNPSSNTNLFTSPSFESQTGYSVEEMSVDPAGYAKKVTHPDDWDEVCRLSDEHIQKGPGAGTLTLEYRVIRKDGEIIWVEDRKDFDWSADGKQFWINGIVRDISPSKEAQANLEKSENDLRALFETMLEGFALLEMIFDDKNIPLDSGFSQLIVHSRP